MQLRKNAKEKNGLRLMVNEVLFYQYITAG